ncbi:MAG: hypothetical protein IKP52_05675 [Prevotella sp.]|nr:hypothetical protein [Prevotella sp.]
MFESVECLIKNDFRKFNDLQAVLTELNHAANVLNELFHLPRGLEFGPQGLETGGYSIYTDSDCDIYRIYLKDGYWHMVSGYVYSALFESDLKLRQNFVKAAKALGQQEAWYCDNYHLEDCSAQKWNYDVQTFEEWLEYINSTYGPIKDYPLEEILAYKGDKFPFEPVYHDSFRDI